MAHAERPRAERDVLPVVRRARRAFGRDMARSNDAAAQMLQEYALRRFLAGEAARCAAAGR